MVLCTVEKIISEVDQRGGGARPRRTLHDAPVRSPGEQGVPPEPALGGPAIKLAKHRAQHMTRLGWFEFQEKLIRLPLILSPPLSFGPL